MPFYRFRGAQVGQKPSAHWCAAPIDAVISTFGGGGIYGEQGLLATFGGGALFRNQAEEKVLLGVWGARNCSRFCRLLREAGHALPLADLPPGVRLAIRWA